MGSEHAKISAPVKKSSAPGDYDSATICLRVVGRVADPVRV